MKALLSAILGLSITCAVLAASAAAEADTSQIPPKGYVVLKGEQARLARSGNLFRIVVRELVRKDGTKTTIYRDVDYPIRATAKEADAPVKAVLIEVPSDQPTETEEETEAAEKTRTAPPASAPSVQVYLGPEYEDPPRPDASPSPYRLRRPGPSSVIYECDKYVLSGGKEDEVLRLEFDFSGTHPQVRRGDWSMENEAGEIIRTKKAGWDFVCEQGAYGIAYGKIETANLQAGAPDELVVTLVREADPEKKSQPDDDAKPLGGTGEYRLKRKKSEAK